MSTFIERVSWVIAVAACVCCPEAGMGQFPMSETAKGAWPPETRALFDEIYGRAVDVSIVRVLANPEEFSGKALRLWGVFHVERETMALFLNRESYEYGVSQNAIPISTTYTQLEDLPKLSGHYVWVVGVFDAKDGGPVGFSATGNGHLHDVLPIVPAQVRLKMREAALSVVTITDVAGCTVFDG